MAPMGLHAELEHSRMYAHARSSVHFVILIGGVGRLNEGRRGGVNEGPQGRGLNQNKRVESK